MVALLRNGAGPVVMLRTELDALPVAEKTGVAFASVVTVRNLAGATVPVMHACGHDLHMTAWIGTARWMAEHRQQWQGTLMLVGQPAEETSGGAAAMLADGLFTRFPKPDFVVGFHDDDTMPAGTIGFHPGPFRAMSISPTITLFGRGGHGAMPFNTVDPVVMASRTVLALQTIVSRENNPMDPVVVTIGSIHGGTQGNVIPDEVKLELSVRTFTDEVQARVLASIARIARAEAQAAGAPRDPEITLPASGHVVVNDPDLTRRLGAALQQAIGADRVVEMPAKMTSEDFSEFGRAGIPSVLLHIGAVNPQQLAEARRTGIPVPAPHSPNWLPDLEPTLKAAIRGKRWRCSPSSRGGEPGALDRLDDVIRHIVGELRAVDLQERRASGVVVHEGRRLLPVDLEPVQDNLFPVVGARHQPSAAVVAGRAFARVLGVGATFFAHEARGQAPDDLGFGQDNFDDDERRAPLDQRIERFGLGNRAGKPVEEEPVPRIRLPQPFPDDLGDGAVVNEAAALHDDRDLAPQGGIRLNSVAQHRAGRDVRNAPAPAELSRLRPLTGPRGTQHDYVQLHSRYGIVYSRWSNSGFAAV